MRCLNCGWENNAGTPRCIKCNMPLSGTMGAGVQPPVTPPPANPNTPADEAPIQGTIAVGKVEIPAWDEAVAPSSREQPLQKGGNPEQCPHCQYPLMKNVEYDVCPSCNRPIKAKDAPSPSPNAVGTIDPYRQVDAARFSLILLGNEDENIRRPINFIGTEVSLNRDVLDPDNMAITSKVQAVIKLVDGAWYIHDESEKQTTFVRADSPVKLKKGDIILIGNRKFIFNP